MDLEGFSSMSIENEAISSESRSDVERGELSQSCHRDSDEVSQICSELVVP
jgi:hypothetical protein